MERRLSAILAADVVGYSALMEQDEAGTFDRLRAHRKELFEPEIEKHHGRIFKLTGDGVFAEFSSVVDAVECAVALQRGLAERNIDVPEERRIDIRIGINLGEVIVEGDDRIGEGVNIAARLEQLAEPSGICVSGKVAKEVERKLSFIFEPMGEKRVKNINEPIPVFRVKLDGTPVRKSSSKAWSRAKSKQTVSLAAIALILAVGLVLGASRWLASPQLPAKALATDARPSLVVLPFDSLNEDKEQSYLADGITEDLTTELARIPSLLVMSRNAAFSYKGKVAQPAQVSKELGVRYILEGSIRRIGDDLRINAQLIDASSGGHLWAERFDGEWSNVFQFQDKMVESIASALKMRLVVSQSVGETTNPAAYEIYLRGRELQRSENPADWAKSVIQFEKALELDPKFGSAAAELAWIYRGALGAPSRLSALGVTDEQAGAKAATYLDEAAKNPSSKYFQVLSAKLIYHQRSDEAITAAQRAIALNPSDSWGYEQLGQALTFNGRALDGLSFIEAAARIDPEPTAWRNFITGLAYFTLDRFGDAASIFEKLDSSSEKTGFWDFWANYDSLKLLVATYGHLGRSAEVPKIVERIKPYLLKTQDRELTGLLAMISFPFQNYRDLERVLEGLRKASVPELPYGLDSKSRDRLSGPAIKELLFGHDLEGRVIDTGESYYRTTSGDGKFRVKIGNWSDEGIGHIEGDTMCTVVSTISNRFCHAVFRSQDGVPAEKNEYLMAHPWLRFQFSVVK